MKPHGVVKACHLYALGIPRETVWQQGGIEQREIARIGCDAGVQHRVISEASVGAHPHALPE